MKPLLSFLELAGGVLLALLSIFSILLGGIVGLTEIPKHLRKLR